jgi:transposase-like protein
MEQKSAFPQTLAQAIRYFADLNNCIDFLANLRWPDGVTCPTCGSKEVSFVSTRRIWKCKQQHDHRQFSIKVGTIMEDSAIPLDKWLTAMWLICNCRNGVSSYEIHRALGVTQKTAWFMLHRIRLAMKNGSIEKLGGEGGGPVEVDETFVGAKHKFMHKSRLKKMRAAAKSNVIPSENPYTNKTVVFGMFDREARKVRAMVIPNVKRATLQDKILNNIKGGATVYSDEFPIYKQFVAQSFTHDFVNHMEGYVKGQVHTNGIENFWSLLKRGLRGTYVAVEPYHLDRYIDEQIFRYNNRKDEQGNKLSDAERFQIAASQIVGKRLTFAEVTGKVGETAF